MKQSIRRIVREGIDALTGTPHTMQTVYGAMFRPAQNILAEYEQDGQTIRLTYGEVREQIERVSAALYARIGATHGYVALEMENRVEWIVAFWAILRSGNKPYLVNTRHPKRLSQGIVRTLGVRCVLGFGATQLDAEFIDFAGLTGGDAAFAGEFEDEFALSTSATTLHEVACIYTGREVAAQLLNTPNILRDCPQMSRHYHGSLKQLAFLPFYHVFGLFAVYFWFTFFGRTLVFLPDYSADAILKTCRRHEVTHVFAVPMLWHQIEAKLGRTLEREGKAVRFRRALRLCTALQNLCPSAGEAFSRRLLHQATDRLFGRSVRFCISGGGYLRPEALALLNGLGYNLHNGYGMSETGITSVELRSRPKYRNRGSVGRPFRSVEYRLSERGTLLIHGESVCSRRIVDGERFDRELWLDSGDVAECIDNDWYLCGRLGDVVIGENGENINPDVVEQHFTLPDAEKLSVLGLPAAGGERLALVVQLSPFLSAQRIEALIATTYRDNETLPSPSRVRDFYYTNDPIASPTAIKVGRQYLLCALKNGDVTLHTFSELRARSASRSGTDPALAARVRAIVARELGVDEAQIRDDSHIVNELGADSLSYLSLLGAIDAEFGLPAPVGEETRCTTVAEFCDYIERNIL